MKKKTVDAAIKQWNKAPMTTKQKDALLIRLVEYTERQTIAVEKIAAAAEYNQDISLLTLRLLEKMLPYIPMESKIGLSLMDEFTEEIRLFNKTH